ncbi:phage antirepressor N-terminal domain-containing protein [Solidesulfovibrio sp.]
MSSSANLSPVQFHGKTLFVATVNNQPFTPMRPIVEGMGMAWSPQRVKLTANAGRWGVTMIVTPSEGGSQETLCMPLRKLPGWLMTINPKKVAPAIRETVTLYQDECDDALWDFWTKGEAVNKRKAPALPSPRTRNTLADYCALYSSLPGSPKYFLDLLTEYANAHDVLARKLEEVKTEATKPFRVGRKSMVQTYFDAAMSPMHSLFDNAEKTLHLSYCQMFDALHGCRNIWLLLHKG